MTRYARHTFASLLAAASLVVVGCGSSESSSVTVPNVAGMAPGKAIAVLCADGLRVAHTVYVAGQSTPAYSASPASKVATELGLGVGHVDRTNPAAGAQVARGSLVTLGTSGSSVTLYASNAGCAQ